MVFLKINNFYNRLMLFLYLQHIFSHLHIFLIHHRPYQRHIIWYLLGIVAIFLKIPSFVGVSLCFPAPLFVYSFPYLCQTPCCIVSLCQGFFLKSKPANACDIGILSPIQVVRQVDCFTFDSTCLMKRDANPSFQLLAGL